MGKSRVEQEKRRTTFRKSEMGCGPADWHDADPLVVMGAVARVSASGGALRFGYTRDGGAFAVGVYGEGAPFTDYIRPSEGINDYLKGLTLDWGSAEGAEVQLKLPGA